MTTIEIRNAVVGILRDIVPDEFDELHDEQPFQEQLDLDSMDFLDIMMELRKTFGIQIPEEDYTQLTTMEKVVAYIEPLLCEAQHV